MTTTNGAVKPPIDKEVLQKFLTMVTNGAETRMAFGRQFFSRLFDPRRDINAECGYPETTQVTVEMLQNLYEREPVAAAVVEYFPNQCWRISPEIYEKEDSNTDTPFEQSWDALGESLAGVGWYKQEKGSCVFEYLKRLEVQSGIGAYGVLLLGFDDGLDLSQPVKGVEEAYSAPASKANKNPTYSGVYNLTTNAAKTKGRKLLYLRVFPQSLAEINQWENNPTSPRYCQPTMYSLTFIDPSSVTMGFNSRSGVTRMVHWTRVHHLPSDNLASSEVLGVSRMMPVLNPLLDIQKIRGADGEGYWKNCFANIFLEMLPEYSDVKLSEAGLRDMMEQMMNGLQKWGVLEGLSAKSLPPAMTDPTPHIATHIQAISIKTGIPKRILEGSERGELASGQDADKSEADLQGRRDNFSTPRNLVPFVNRLILVGVLEEPGEDGFMANWPKEETATDTEKAQIAGLRTTALTTYVSGGGEQVVAPLDFLTKFLEFDDEEAQAMLDTTEEHMMEKEQEDMAKQQDLIDKGLAPDPTAPPPVPGTPIKMKQGEKLVTPDGKSIGKGFPPKVPTVHSAPSLNFLSAEDLTDNEEATDNVFCPTGEGGGVDPSCSPGDGGSGGRKLPDRYSKDNPAQVGDTVEYHSGEGGVRFDESRPVQGKIQKVIWREQEWTYMVQLKTPYGNNFLIEQEHVKPVAAAGSKPKEEKSREADKSASDNSKVTADWKKAGEYSKSIANRPEWVDQYQVKADLQSQRGDKTPIPMSEFAPERRAMEAAGLIEVKEHEGKTLIRWK